MAKANRNARPSKLSKADRLRLRAPIPSDRTPLPALKLSGWVVAVVLLIAILVEVWP